MLTSDNSKQLTSKLSNNESIRQKLEQIQKYLEVANENAEENDKYKYIFPQLSKLAKMMEECEQYDLDIDPDGEAIYTTRVFRCKRYIPNYILDFCHMDTAKIGGLFIKLSCFLLPANKVEKASKNKYKNVMHPDEYGLPSNKEANYGTIRRLDDNCYICLARHESNMIYRDWIFTARHIEYVYAK